MIDATVIILVGKEERHIRRCLERIAPLEPRRIVVVESQKGDRTLEIVEEVEREWREERGGEGEQWKSKIVSVWHDWPGTQAAQFNWALDEVVSSKEKGVSEDGEGAEWILRLDADEYLTDEGIKWLKERLGGVEQKYAALEFTLERKFCGGAIRHGTNGIPMVRMFRCGKARYAEGGMDERFVVDGETLKVPVTFYDDSLMPMDEWREKHRGYAKREARQAVESMRSGVWTDPRKATYYKLPPYLRAVVYFGVRYFLKGGILDGYAGWMWNFWQGLWYRWIVDREIGNLI